MQEKKNFTIISSKKTRHILPNLLTLIGVCLGISSIKFSLDSNYTLAVIFIVVAALLDTLDGRIARLIKGTSDFGKELDSLTDFVSFGIAPAFIIYFWELNNYGKIGWAITLIYSVCCVLRLARFNITKINENESWKNNFFEGIPSPAGALLILMPLIYELSNFQIDYNIKAIVPYFNLLVAIMLISKVPTFALKKVSINPKLTIFILLVIGVAFVSLIFFTFGALLFIGIGYLLSIPFAVIIYLYHNKNKASVSEEEHEDVL